MTAIEIIAAISGLWCVWLTVRRNILCWPVGLVQVVLYVWVFWQARLYSDAGLNAIYIFLQFYGWWAWLHGGEKRHELSLSRVGESLSLWVVGTLVITVGWGYIMDTYTQAAVPYPDSFTTMASLTATYLMARKKIESWWFWIAVDVIAIGVYVYKELYITAGLYAVFLVMATLGFIEWRRTFIKEDTLSRLIGSAEGRKKLAETLTEGAV